METGFLSLDELFHVEDSQITRAWFESTSLTPLEAIEKAEEHHELQEKVDDLLKNLHDEQELRLRMEERISKLSACLDSLRVRAFGADTFRQSSEFDDEFMFCEQDSQTLNDFWAPYCPDLLPRPSPHRSHVQDHRW